MNNSNESFIPRIKKMSCFLYPLIKLQIKHYGTVLNPTYWWGRFPFLFYLVAFFLAYLERKRSKIEPVLRTLILLRVSQRCHCAFCIDANSLKLAERHQCIDKLHALVDWQHSALFTAKEKAALGYADSMTDTPPLVSEATQLALKTFFNDKAVTELTAIIAFQNLSARFNAALAIPEQGLCAIKSNDNKN